MQGNFLFSHSDQLNRFAEHYSELASDVTQRSLDNEYWVSLFGTNPDNNTTWDINDPIIMEEIQNTVLDMKNNKAPLFYSICSLMMYWIIVISMVYI